jgi:hypothetical protein
MRACEMVLGITCTLHAGEGSGVLLRSSAADRHVSRRPPRNTLCVPNVAMPRKVSIVRRLGRVKIMVGDRPPGRLESSCVEASAKSKGRRQSRESTLTSAVSAATGPHNASSGGDGTHSGNHVARIYDVRKSDSRAERNKVRAPPPAGLLAQLSC